MVRGAVAVLLTALCLRHPHHLHCHQGVVGGSADSPHQTPHRSPVPAGCSRRLCWQPSSNSASVDLQCQQGVVGGSADSPHQTPHQSPVPARCNRRLCWRPFQCLRHSHHHRHCLRGAVGGSADGLVIISAAAYHYVTLIRPPQDRENSSEISFKRWWRKKTRWTLWYCFLLNTYFLLGCMICTSYYIHCFMFSCRFVCFGNL